MPIKKTVREPIEKLSKTENVVYIEDSDSGESESSSDEEEYNDEENIPVEPVITEPVIAEPKEIKPKRVRSAKQLANDQRMRDKAKKPQVQAEHIQETLAPPPKLKRAYNKKVVPVAKDPDDELMTVKQYKALLLAQKEEPKPKRKYVKKIKPEPLEQHSPPPTPSKKQQPQMMWA